MLMYSMLGYACFEHSNFFKVNDPEPVWTPPEEPSLSREEPPRRRGRGTRIDRKIGSGNPVRVVRRTVDLRGSEIQLRAF